MAGEGYKEGDFIQIRDEEAARASISWSSEIEKGIILQVVHKSGSHLVCKKHKPNEEIRVKPFPPGSGKPFTVHAGDVIPQQEAGRKVVDDEDKELSTDVSDLLSQQDEVNSDVLK